MDSSGGLFRGCLNFFSECNDLAWFVLEVCKNNIINSLLYCNRIIASIATLKKFQEEGAIKVDLQVLHIFTALLHVK